MCFEERCELGALGRVGAAIECGRSDLELAVGVAHLAVDGLEARRIEHEQLVEPRNEVAHHVGDAKVLGFAHQRGRDVVERHRPVEDLEDGERFDAQRRLSGHNPQRVAHEQDFALAVAHR
ncbi:MAG: hypothetical protein E6K72_13365, partial [Candidatus Eisenbacteria bacterium]